jgi:hypothetical protein
MVVHIFRSQITDRSSNELEREGHPYEEGPAEIKSSASVTKCKMRFGDNFERYLYFTCA